MKTLKAKLRRSFSLDKETLEYVRDYNRKVFSTFCIIGMVMLTLLYFTTFTSVLSTYFGPYRNTFAIFAGILVVVNLIWKFVMIKHKKFVLLFCYFIIYLLLTFGILVGPVLDRDSIGATFFVLLVAMPLFLVDNPYRTSAFLFGMIIMFIVESYIYKDTVYFVLDVINCFVYFSLVTIVNIYIQNIRLKLIKSFLNAEKEKNFDEMTKVLRKDAAVSKIKSRISTSERGFSMAMIIFDVDDFKGINDNYGHLYGDVVISTVGEVLRETFKDVDVIGRFGGDEFFVCLCGLAEKGYVTTYINCFIKNFNSKIKGKNNDVKVTFSFGCACSPKDGTTYEELMEKADKALYLAKNSGKNKVCFYG